MSDAAAETEHQVPPGGWPTLEELPPLNSFQIEELKARSLESIAKSLATLASGSGGSDSGSLEKVVKVLVSESHAAKTERKLAKAEKKIAKLEAQLEQAAGEASDLPD